MPSDRLRNFFAFAQCAPGKGWAELQPLGWLRGITEVASDFLSCGKKGKGHGTEQLLVEPCRTS